MTVKQKVKRVLKNITFDHDKAHLALCSKEQGAANNRNNALIYKAARSQEFIEKAQKVQVTLSLPEFLERFFNVYGSDAEVLARLMGYNPEQMKEEQKEPESYEDWIQMRLAAFTLLNEMNQSEDIEKAAAALSDEDYLKVLQDQEMIEKAFNELTKETPSDVDTSTTVETKVEASASKVTKKKGKQMDNQVEMVEKSALTAIEKEMQEAKVELEKARQALAQVEAEKKQAIVKSKTAQIEAVLKDAKQVEIVAKAALALESDDEFNAFVEVVKGLVAQVEKSDLFNEVGASGAAEEKKEESSLTKLIKARYVDKK